MKSIQHIEFDFSFIMCKTPSWNQYSVINSRWAGEQPCNTGVAPALSTRVHKGKSRTEGPTCNRRWSMQALHWSQRGNKKNSAYFICELEGNYPSPKKERKHQNNLFLTFDLTRQAVHTIARMCNGFCFRIIVYDRLPGARFIRGVATIATCYYSIYHDISQSGTSILVIAMVLLLYQVHYEM